MNTVIFACGFKKSFVSYDHLLECFPDIKNNEYTRRKQRNVDAYIYKVSISWNELNGRIERQENVAYRSVAYSNVINLSDFVYSDKCSMKKAQRYVNVGCEQQIDTIILPFAR